MEWTVIFKHEVDGRPVEGLRSDEGDLRVKTVTKSDYDGFSESNNGSMVIIPPAAAGTKIDIDGGDRASLRQSLITDGEFSEADAEAIVASF